MHLGTVRHTLRVEDGQYAMEEVAEGHGLIGALVERVIGGQYIVRSSGSIGPGGFMPQEYFAQRGRPERRERAIFNWDRGSIDLYWRDEQRTLPLPPGTQDVLSSMHQLYFMRPLPAQGLFEIASGRKLAQTPFEVLGTEQIPTGLGERRAVHIRRLDPDGDRVELWLDPVSQLLPLRVYAAYRNADPMDFVIRRMAVVPAEGH